MAASLDQAHVEKKFKGVTTTQESIQSLSMWVIHHKAQHERIVDIWFGVLKKAKLDHRLTMFYLCNDIVQLCRKKHAVMYKDAFKEVLKDATLFVRDSTVRPAIERIFKIWAERGIYDEEFTEELVAIINNTKVRSTINSKLLADFQPMLLMEKVITLKRFEDELELKRRQLVSLRMDASSVEAVRQLKDRTHGGEFCAEFESACTKMEDYVKSLEKEMADRTSMIEMLEQSELYYDAQYGEAKIVANAYKNFGGRVANLQKKLEDKVVLMPDSMSPVPSPPLFDAPSPSPENSPLADEMPDLLDSPIPPGVTTPEHLNRSYDMDIQHVDMDMSDDEHDHRMAATRKRLGGGNYRRQESTHVTPAYPDPISSVTDIHLLQTTEGGSHHPSLSPRSDEEDVAGPQGSPLVVDNEDKKAGYIPSVGQGASSSFLDMMTGITNNGKESKENDGGSTPVMDEFDTDSSSSKKKGSSSKGDTKPTKQRPIDFLAQLIGQSNNTADSSSSSSSFFKNLSVLTETVKSKMETEEKPGQPNNTADQWAAWKALQGPPPQLSPPAAMGAAPQPMPPTPPGAVGPQLPPPPRIHPSLMPMPTPPFPTPLPPPPVLPQQDSNPYPQQQQQHPPPGDPNYHPPPPGQPHNYNVPHPQNNAFPPPPGQQENRYPQGPPGNGYRPSLALPNQNYPTQQQNSRYASPAVSTATSPSYPPPPAPQNSNYHGQTTPPATYRPPLTPTTPTAGFPRPDNNYQQPRMFHRPPAPTFPTSNTNSYAAPRTYTPQSPFMAPPPTPPLQQASSGPRFPGGGDQNPPSQQQDSWGSNDPPSPTHGVQFTPSGHRSNLTTIKTVDDQDLLVSSNSNTTIPTIGQGPPHLSLQNNTGMPHPPGGQPPSPNTPGRVGCRGDDGQMEFIEKLKMKSSNQTANHSSNLRTLTEVPIEQPEQLYHPRNIADHSLVRQGGPGEVTTMNFSRNEGDMNEQVERIEENNDMDLVDDDEEEEDEEEDDDGNEGPKVMGQAVGSFLQQIRQEAASTSSSSSTSGERVDQQQQPEPPSPHHHNVEFNLDRNTHRGSFQQSPQGRPIVGQEEEQGHFGGSRFRMRHPEGVPPRQFSGPRSPFGRPPQRHFEPRQFGFANKRPGLIGIPGRPYFPRY